MPEEQVLKIDIPSIDTEVLKKQAIESAIKGALAEIKDYYEGYNSPFRKVVKEALSQQEIDSSSFSVPNILGLINEGMKGEIDKIVNNTIANSFLPMVTDLFSGMEKEMTLTEMLQRIRNRIYDDDIELEAYSEKDSSYGWYNIKVNIGKRRGVLRDSDKYQYTITLHEDREAPGKYRLLSMPWKTDAHHREMKVCCDDKRYIQMPFDSSISNDVVSMLCAKMLISGTRVTVDFDGEYFPEGEYED